MSNAAKLKKKAVEFEQKRQYDKALALYVQALDEAAAAKEEPEVALHNRVGDLLLRLGNVDEAIRYYSSAVALYADGGFLNNAIALCNKILRHDPGQSAVHYTLGRISAQKGFRSDAKYHFLEFAERMQRAGRLDESFSALKEFADLCPDQDDIRLMLAEQLAKQGRGEEAVEQLQILHEHLVAEGRSTEAQVAAERMAAIDPTAVPRALGLAPTPKADGGLVFLDVSWEGQRPNVGRESDRHVGNPSPPPAPLSGVEATALAQPTPDATTSDAASILDGEQEPHAADAARAAAPAPVAGLEPTALELDPVPEAPVLALSTTPTLDDSFGLRDLTPPAPPAAEPANAHEGADGNGPAGTGDAAALDDPELPVPPLDLPIILSDPLESTPNHAPATGELTLIMPDLGDDATSRDGAAAALAGLPLIDDSPPPLAPRAPAESLAQPGADGAAFVNLGDWLRETEPPKSTRMVTDAQEPGEGEEFDFADMLRKFKRGVAENVDEDDHDSHYDLGVAYKEMGLVDEAIAEFQKALRGRANRARTYEALGQCFVDKSQHQVATSVLARALNETTADDDNQLVGVLYLLGAANEALGRSDDAIGFYQRVFAVDIEFRDVGERLSGLERATR